jgi:hypothetical protein
MNIRTNKFFKRVYYFGMGYMIGIVSWCVVLMILTILN